MQSTCCTKYLLSLDIDKINSYFLKGLKAPFFGGDHDVY